MSGYLMKPANAETFARIDWTEGYLEPGERVTADLGWLITPHGEPGDPELRDQRVEPTASLARIARGRPGQVHMLAARARTDRGRELERAIVMRIGA